MRTITTPRRFRALVAAAFVVALPVATVDAHTALKSATPGKGKTVRRAVKEVKATFGASLKSGTLQIENGISGYLVDSADACAARALDILKDPALGKALGRRGKEHVRKHFLTPRYLRDYLQIFHELLEV